MYNIFRYSRTYKTLVLQVATIAIGILPQGCVTHHDIQVDPHNAAPEITYATFEIIQTHETSAPGDPVGVIFENPANRTELLRQTLGQSGYQEAQQGVPPDFLVSVFSDYLPPGSKPPPPPSRPTLPDPQIIIDAQELESLDPNKKAYWRIVIELYDPQTREVIWSAYAETSNGNHFKHLKNRRNALGAMIAKIPR